MATTEELLAENNNLLKSFLSKTGTSAASRDVPASGISSFNNAAGLAGKAVEGLGGAFGSAKEIVSESLDAYKEFSKFGVNFGNDALGFRSSIAGTRMTVQEYGQTLDRLIPNITALGGTVTDGAKNFNRLSKEFSDTSAADELRKIGYTTKEYNEVLAISVAGRRNIDMQDAGARQKANTAAADLALEMDKVAQLTGVSRQEQQRALQEKQGNARVQAAIEMQVRQGGQDAAAAYQQMTVQMKGLGLDKLADEIYSGQALSQESIAQLNALGPAGSKLRDAINQVRNATDEESRARANAALREAQASVARQVTSDQSLNQIRYGQGETAEALGKISISARNYANAIESEKDKARKAGQEISDEEAARNVERRARYSQDLANGKAEADAQKNLEAAKKSGTEAEIAAAQARVKEVQDAKTAAKPTEVLVQVIARLNDTLNALIQGADATAKGLTKSGSAGEKILNAADSFSKNQQMAGGKPTSGLDRAGIVNLPNYSEIQTAIASGDWVGAGRKVADGFKDALGNLAKTANLPTGSTPAPRAQFAEGTAGASFDIGKLVQDFGSKTTVDLHGKEAVVTEDQLKKLVSGVMSGSMVSTKQTSTTTNETISGGSETTTKRVQSEDSKIAQAEIDSLREKFGQDWQKRKEILVEGMAVEDRKFSKVQSVMKADTEAQRIKEEYDAKRAELQKRVDDGIKFEIETKTAATEKIASLVEESSLKELNLKQVSSKNIVSIAEESGLKELNLKQASSEKVLEPPKTPTNTESMFSSFTKSITQQFGNIKLPDFSQIKNLSKTIPNEIAQARTEEAKKTTPLPMPKKEIEPPKTIANAATTLDDLKEQLIQLNKSMGEMVSNSSEMISNIEKQVRATKRMDPNISLRG